MRRRPIVLNQSSKKVFMNCQRRFGWIRNQGLEPIGRRSALDIGTAFHTAMAVYHAGGVEGLLKRTVELYDQARGDEQLKLGEEVRHLERTASLPLVEQALLVAIRQVKGFSVSWQDKSEDEAVEILDRMIPAYFEYWGSRGELWTPLGQEIKFCVEVGDGTDNFLRGKSDNLSTWKNGLYLVDYKTAGRMDVRDLMKYELDDQLSSYIYGLSKHLTLQSLAKGGEPVFIRGAIIDVAVKTKVPQFAREFFTRSVDELEEFEAEFNEYANRLRDQLDRVDSGENWKTVFPKNTDDCFRYGTCPFRDICLKDTPVRRKLYNVREKDYVDEMQEVLDAQWKEQCEAGIP